MTILKITASLALMLLPMLPATVHAQTATQNQINSGVTCGTQLQFNSNCGAQATNTSNSITHLLTIVINIFSLIVGVVAVIMIIIGGFKYITSGGESSNVSGAKNTIIYAIVGLVIVVLAQVIVHFVLNRTISAANG